MSVEQTGLEQNTPPKGEKPPLLEPNIVNNRYEEVLRGDETFSLKRCPCFEKGLYIKDDNGSFIPIESEEHFEKAFSNFKAFFEKNK